MRIINKARPMKLLCICGQLLKSLNLLFRQMKNSTPMRKGYYKENKGLEKFIYAFAIKFQMADEMPFRSQTESNFSWIFSTLILNKNLPSQTLKDSRVGQEISPLNISPQPDNPFPALKYTFPIISTKIQYTQSVQFHIWYY